MGMINLGSIPGKQGMGGNLGQGMLAAYLQETQRRQAETQRLKERGEVRTDLVRSPEYQQQRLALQDAQATKRMKEQLIRENPELEPILRIGASRNAIETQLLVDAYKKAFAGKPAEEQAAETGKLKGITGAAETVASASPEAIKATQQKTDASESTNLKDYREQSAAAANTSGGR